MSTMGADWRVVDGVATAWFDAPSLIEGAALAGRIVELSAADSVFEPGLAPGLDPDSVMRMSNMGM